MRSFVSVEVDEVAESQLAHLIHKAPLLVFMELDLE